MNNLNTVCKVTKGNFFYFLCVTCTILFFSCRTIKVEPVQVSRSITGTSVLSAHELVVFFMKSYPDSDKQLITRMANYYVSECRDEGINSDVAFAQMCLETGWLRFGNLVTPEMHNYCGLGAIDAEHPGEWFETEQLGVRAHIQHLQAYATVDKSLNNKLIDNRYKWVKRGRAQDIFGLAGTWAMDKEYGNKLDIILTRMENSVNGKTR